MITCGAITSIIDIIMTLGFFMLENFAFVNAEARRTKYIYHHKSIYHAIITFHKMKSYRIVVEMTTR